MGRDEMLGRLVRSRAGHDLGEICLADGKGRSQEKPKRKNKKHLTLLNTGCSAQQKELLSSGEKLKEEEIRKLIRTYRKEAGEA